MTDGELVFDAAEAAALRGPFEGVWRALRFALKGAGETRRRVIALTVAELLLEQFRMGERDATRLIRSTLDRLPAYQASWSSLSEALDPPIPHESGPILLRMATGGARANVTT